MNRWIDPELADPNGSTASLGGISQTIPMFSLYLKDADLERAVDFEIRAARQLGVDGFQFYYPLGDNVRGLINHYNPIVREFIRQSETRYPGFKVSICLSHPRSEKARTEAEMIELWSEPIRDLVEPTKESPAWLRDQSGSILFYLWVGDHLADGVNHLAGTPDQIRSVGRAYRRLSEAVGTPFGYVYQVRRPVVDPPYVEAIVETFPAVWGWTASEENIDFWDYLARRCKARDTLYTQTVYPDYYTSKTYPKGSKQHRILSSEQAMAAGVQGIERHYRVTNLSATQIDLLRRAVDHDVSIINYVTWNDFPEGHHLAPEVNHNFGPAVLLRHFKRQWRTGRENVTSDDAILFFKKYASHATPKYPVSLKIKSDNKNLVGEDRIELVTLLTEPADCFLNDRPLGTVAAGLRVHSIPTEPGPVRVRIVRDGRTIIAFTTPIEITDSPLRTDRLTYSYSGSHDREFKQLFEVEPPKD